LGRKNELSGFSFDFGGHLMDERLATNFATPTFGLCGCKGACDN